jgi:myo-inositol-1(or 4)-monophosphatase
VSESLRGYLDFAVETAYLAGRLTLGHFQTGVRPDFKADDTPVTIADRQSEELIRAASRNNIRATRSGEEQGAKEVEGATHRWLIDPIDGTKAFVRGVPLYGVLLGLEIEGTVRVGAAFFPAMGEMLAAASGEGCWWNGRRAYVSNITDLGQAVVTFTDGEADKYGRSAAWKRIASATFHRAVGVMRTATCSSPQVAQS